MITTPSRWVVLTFQSTDGPVDKVLMGFSGGYLDASSWRLNSGVVEVIDDGDAYIFVGHSGSKYRCLKSSYGFTAVSAAALDNLLRQVPKDLVTVRATYPY